MLSYLSHPPFHKSLTPHLIKVAEGRTLGALAPAFAITEMIWWTGLAPLEFEFP